MILVDQDETMIIETDSVMIVRNSPSSNFLICASAYRPEIPWEGSGSKRDAMTLATYETLEDAKEQIRCIARAANIGTVYYMPSSPDADLLRTPINRLRLSARVCCFLKLRDINTIGELAQCAEADLLKTKNFGRHSLNELKRVLREHGLNFAT